MIAPDAALAMIAPGSLAVVGALALIFFYPKILPPLGRLLGIVVGLARSSSAKGPASGRAPGADVTNAIGPLQAPDNASAKPTNGLSVWAGLALVGAAAAVLSWLLFRPR